MAELKCGPLVLEGVEAELGGDIWEWKPEGQHCPCIHVYRECAFLYLMDMLELREFGESNQAAADALHAAIMDSADPAVVRFRKEWM